jgi:uncharacterized membrane protein
VVAAFSPTGLGVSTGHDILHKGFYESLMTDANWELGAAAQKGKLRLFESGSYVDLLHTYTIFGDPTLQIQNPFQFEAAPEESEVINLSPGATVTHTLTLTNTGGLPDTYDIEVDSGWPATAPSSLTVNPGNQVDIPIEIDTPYQDDISDTAVVTITSQGDATYVFNAQLTTITPNVYDFAVSPLESYVLAHPGTTITHTLTLTNQGYFENNYTITLAGNIWPTTLPYTITPAVNAGESLEIHIEVAPPNEQDINDTATVTIAPVEGIPDSVEVTLTTRVPRDYEFEITPQVITQTVPPGEVITYAITLQNTGLKTDSYQIAVSGYLWPTTLSVTSIGPLDFQESVQFYIQVEAPWQTGVSDSATVTVTSVTVLEETRQASITTTTASLRIYLPLATK